jgi:hypothetical protein
MNCTDSYNVSFAMDDRFFMVLVVDDDVMMMMIITASCEVVRL